MKSNKQVNIISLIILTFIIILGLLLYYSINLYNNNKHKDDKNILMEYAKSNKFSKTNSANIFNGRLIKCEKIDNENLDNCSIDNKKNKYCLKDNEFVQCKNNESLIDILKINNKLANNTFKGKNPNNYLWYGGFLWRIISFDDNSLLIITNNSITNLKSSFKAWNNESEYNNSLINHWLNDYFYNLLDDDFKNNILFTNFNIGEYNKIGKIKTSKQIGLLDEEQYLNIGADKSYLNINDTFQLGNKYNENYLRIVKQDGQLYSNISSIIGIRPVVKISDLIEIKGNGTYKEPYRIDENKLKIGDYVNIKSNSEYCKNCLFRIIYKDESKIKLISNSILATSSYDNIEKFNNSFKNKTKIIKKIYNPKISELFTSNDININDKSLSKWFWTEKESNIYYAVNNDGIINRIDKNMKIGVRPVIDIDNKLKIKGLGTYNNPYEIH